MYCPYCKKRIQLTRDIKTPKWIASCDCARGVIAWLERAEKIAWWRLIKKIARKVRVMGKKLTYTPNSKIKAALRQLFLRSRERAAALKRDGYTCQRCGCKQSRARGREQKVQVHHKVGVMNWDALYRAVREYLLCNPEFLETLCPECHKKEGDGV
jgi:predicted HNH restriction endonuclease